MIEKYLKKSGTIVEQYLNDAQINIWTMLEKCVNNTWRTKHSKNTWSTARPISALNVPEHANHGRHLQIQRNIPLQPEIEYPLFIFECWHIWSWYLKSSVVPMHWGPYWAQMGEFSINWQLPKARNDLLKTGDKVLRRDKGKVSSGGHHSRVTSCLGWQGEGIDRTPRSTPCLGSLEITLILGMPQSNQQH